MYMCANVKNVYLNTLPKRPEYMQLALSIILQEIIGKHKFLGKEKNGHVCICIDKGMCGLPPAGRLTNTLLVKRLAPHGYHPVDQSHGLRWHETRPVAFTLVVDNFGVNYVDKENADHLLRELKQHYEVTEDWEGKLYCGISLNTNVSTKHQTSHIIHRTARKPQYGSKV
jgi:hypothetical protein